MMLDGQSGRLLTTLRQSWRAACLQMETEIEMRTMALGHGTAQFDKKLNLRQRCLRNEIATSQGKVWLVTRHMVLRYAGARVRELGKDGRAIYLTRGVLKIYYPMQW
jgi:hypothetical protein